MGALRLYWSAYAGFADNWKTKRLARELKVEDSDCVLGKLVRLFEYCIEQAPDGVLHGMDAEGLEARCNWNGEPGAFYAALVKTGWVSVDSGQNVTVSGWMEHSGKLHLNRQRDTQRKAAKRAEAKSEGCPADIDGRSLSDSDSPSRDHACNWDQGEAPAAPEVASQLAGPLASPLPPNSLDRDQHEPCQAAREPEVVTPIVEGPTPCEQRALTVASCDIRDKPELVRNLPIDQIWGFLVNDLRVANGVFPRADVLSDLRAVCAKFAVTKRDLCVAYLGAAGWQREKNGSDRVHVRTVISFLSGNLHQEHKPPAPTLPDELLTQVSNSRRSGPRYTCQEEARHRAISEAVPLLHRSNNLRDEILAEERAAKQKAEV